MTNIFAWKTEILCEIAWKNRNFSEICLEKSKFFNLDPRPPQISNQIDATDSNCRSLKLLTHWIIIIPSIMQFQCSCVALCSIFDIEQHITTDQSFHNDAGNNCKSWWIIYTPGFILIMPYNAALSLLLAFINYLTSPHLWSSILHWLLLSISSHSV